MLDRLTETYQIAKRGIARINNILARGVLTKLTTGKTPTVDVTLLKDETFAGVEFPQDWGFISYPPKDGGTEVLVAFLGGQRDHGTVLRAFHKLKALNLPLKEGESALYNWVTNTYILLKEDGKILIKSDHQIKDEVKTNTVTVNEDGKIDVVAATQITLKITPPDPFRVGSSAMGDALYPIIETYVALDDHSRIYAVSSHSMEIKTPTVLMTTDNLYVTGDIRDNIATNSNTLRQMRTIFNSHVHSGVTAGPSNTGQSTTSQ